MLSIAANCATKLASYTMLRSIYFPVLKVRGPTGVFWWGPPGCGKSYASEVTIPNMLGIEHASKSTTSKWWPANIQGMSYVVM